jgi:tRNA(fMet)-specific endonuclease VapC
LISSYVLDTPIVLALIRGKALGSRINRAFGLGTSLHRHVVSIVTSAELLVLAERNSWGDAKRAALELALDNLVVVPVDGEDLINAYVAVSAADHAHPDGARNLGKNDIWIAATALYTALPLLTTDKDFRFLHDKLLKVMWISPEGLE